MMTRKHSVLSLITMSVVLAVVLLSPRVSANSLVPGCDDPAIADSSTCTNLKETQTASNNRFYGPDGLLTKAASIIMWIGGISAVIMIMLGAFTFITGSGDPNSLAAAKKTIVYAAVGLVVLVMPATIIRFIMSRL